MLIKLRNINHVRFIYVKKRKINWLNRVFLVFKKIMQFLNESRVVNYFRMGSYIVK